MASKLELDVQDVANVLHAPDVFERNVWDPLRTTLVGDTYLLVDEAFVLATLNVSVFQPFTSVVVRRNYVTFEFRQSSGTYHHHFNGQVADMRPGTVTMTAVSESRNEILQIRPSASTRAVAIHIARDLLVETFGLRPDLWREEYRTAFLDRNAPSLHLDTLLTPDMWIAVDNILDCKFDEPIRTVYLKAKAIELLSFAVIQFNAFDRPGGVAKLDPDARNRRLIDIAAMIYRRELSNPPSLEALSQRVGLNRNKLTSGFRLAFGKTPGEYSREIRLRWAARQLSAGVTIRQAAAEAGYESIPAFGRAFRDQFGYAPSEQKFQVADLNLSGDSSVT